MLWQAPWALLHILLSYATMFPTMPKSHTNKQCCPSFFSFVTYSVPRSIRRRQCVRCALRCAPHQPPPVAGGGRRQGSVGVNTDLGAPSPHPVLKARGWGLGAWQRPSSAAQHGGAAADGADCGADGGGGGAGGGRAAAGARGALCCIGDGHVPGGSKHRQTHTQTNSPGAFDVFIIIS